MKVCIFDAWDPADPALVNSHWVAAGTVAALRGLEPFGVSEVIVGADVTRARVEAEFLGTHEGFAYFGHGRAHLLYRSKDEAGAPIPIVGIDQVRQLGARWFHAFACLSGETLCHDAKAAGAAAYLGYRVSVVVEWEVPQLPEALRLRLVDLVTTATLQLATGQRSRETIRRRVREASDSVVEWLEVHEDARDAMALGSVMGLYSLANLLHQKLELEGAAVVP